MNIRLLPGVVASLLTLNTSGYQDNLQANQNLQRRINIIRESMVRGGCRPTQAEKAKEVLAILDTHRAQGMVLYSDETNLTATIQAIQNSRLPQLYLVACGWRATVDIGKTTGYFFYELGYIPIDPPPKVERERRRTGEPIITTPAVWVYRLGAPPNTDWQAPENVDIPF